jgi:hypothetical protein
MTRVRVYWLRIPPTIGICGLTAYAAFRLLPPALAFLGVIAASALLGAAFPLAAPADEEDSL